MEIIKFRIYNPVEKRMIVSGATPMMLHSFFQATAVFNVRYGMEYQQFTGLLDKSGKEIYQGDIIQIGNHLPTQTYEIIFESGDFQTGFKKKSGGSLTDIGKEFAGKFEIIGHIYDPDLLENNE